MSRINVTLVLSLLATSMLVGGAHARPQGPAKQSSYCAPINENLEGDVTLTPGCVYTQSIKITNSGTHLNCNGAELDGQGTIKTGVLIRASTGEINDVSVKNCVIRNFIGAGLMVAVGEGEKSRNDQSPTKVHLDNVTIVDTNGVGLNFNSYVKGVLVTNSKIQGSLGPGIYFSQSSAANIVKNSIIANNGWRPGMKGREGIAIDSSANNIIANNKIMGNGEGGIFIYKNCGEHFSSGKSVVRWQHSNKNQIVDNVFSDEKKGVWIASRQSKNLKKWDCGDQPVDAKSKFYNDYADYNTVRGNVFCSVEQGVLIEGDHNSVTGNRFANNVKEWVSEPYLKKAKPNGNVSVGNSYDKNTPADSECHR